MFESSCCSAIDVTSPEESGEVPEGVGSGGIPRNGGEACASNR